MTLAHSVAGKFLHLWIFRVFLLLIKQIPPLLQSSRGSIEPVYDIFCRMASDLDSQRYLFLLPIGEPHSVFLAPLVWG
ncbi:uncharacterized protein YALI1_F13172g [Yarrowia lipolytica]|uniref:Uncharacterized protein n=1 Tax=Yarrowia lipolytica TaxID=4952 RepID=A0A1D8NMP7_YARLL|nr:hypothetical protein YALI1_F13172g [Yarrowia lipolytica]